MSKPFVSIIICTWNRCSVLARTLASLRVQKVAAGADVEVLIVDNNSSDDTELVVRDAQTDWPLGKLHYLHEERQGKQFALNLGVRSASGEILVFTDDDVVLPKGWIASILDVFEDQAVEMAGGRTLLMWPEGGQPRWFRPTMSAVVAGVDLGVERLQPVSRDYAPAGTNAVVRRSVFDRVGMYSEVHYRHMDYEFGQRALSMGVGVVYDPRLVVETEVPVEVVEKRYFRHWYFKLGIAEAMHGIGVGTSVLLYVPRWLWRQLASDALSVALGRLSGHSDNTFDREVRMFQTAGHICSAWYKRLWPEKYEAWVRRWSQKQGLTFG